MEKAFSQKDIFEELEFSTMLGTFKPRERLIEKNLAVQYNVSRTQLFQ